MQQLEHRTRIRLKTEFPSWYLPRRSRAEGGMTTGSNNKSHDQLIQNTLKKKNLFIRRNFIELLEEDIRTFITIFQMWLQRFKLFYTKHHEISPIRSPCIE